MSRAELVSLVASLMEGDFHTDDELDRAAEALRAAVPHPDVIGLIYWDRRGLTAEQVVDEALAYRPTPL